MRKVIITEEQFKSIKSLNEDATTDDVPVINATADNVMDVAAKGEEMANKVKAQGGTNVKIKVTPQTAPSDSVEVTGQGNSTREQFQDAVDSVSKSGMNKDEVSYSVTLGSDGTPTQNENRSYTKAILEQIRVKNLKKNCKKYTKKSLTESFSDNNGFAEMKDTLNKVTGQAEYHIQMLLNEYNNEVSHMWKDLNKAMEDTEALLDKYHANTNPEVSFNTSSDNMTATFEIEYAIPYNSDEMYEDFEGNLYVKSPYVYIWINEIGNKTLSIRITGETPELPLGHEE